MSKMLVPTKLYKEITKMLYNRGFIKEILPLKWTANSKVYGRLRYHICCKGNEQIAISDYIYINKDACPCTIEAARDDYSSLIELVDTICHEIAHMTYHFEGGSHTILTGLYKDLFSVYLRKNYTSIYALIADCKES